MAKVSGIDFVALQVRDVEAAARFYSEQLGLQRAPVSPPHAVVFQTQPFPFAVRTAQADLDGAAQVGVGVALWMKCDDADALVASLESNGVTIVQAPFDGPFGRTFSFVDRDGYTITVHGGGQ